MNTLDHSNLPVLPSRFSSPVYRLMIALLLLVFALATAQEVYAPRVFELSRQLRCTQCRAQSVAESDAPISVEFRNRIQTMIAEGKSDEEIFAYFRERYGDWIFMEPPKRGVHLIVWLLPVISGVLALGGLFIIMRRWLRKAEPPSDVNEAELARVREAMNQQ